MIRLGILGFAHGHLGQYCSVWQTHPEHGVQLVAGWDHDAARAAARCKALGIDAAPSVEALLGRRDVDAVVITAETSWHADLVERAAAARKAIILQKPLALTVEEADRMVAAVAQYRTPFTLAWQMRVDPQNIKMKELLASGRFGRVFMVRRRHCLSTQLWKDFDKTWHVQPSLNRDIFADDAAHPIDFVYWLLGKPATVMAEMGTLGNPAVRNDNAIVVFRYADGTFAEVSCTFVAAAGENTTEIVCANGVIIGNYGDQPSSMVPRPPGGIQLKWYLHEEGKWTLSDLPDIAGQGERIAGLAVPLAEFLRGVRPPLATVEEGRAVLKLTLACYEAAGQGRRMDLD
jgi:predicted dehydrogenase